ncbi:14679_t:CDS:2, partial [Funneliformis geosporum]
MTEINDESSSSLITVEENEAETVPYDTFVENEALNIDTSFEDNLMSEEGDAATDGGSSLPEEQKKKHIFLVNWVIIDQQPFTLVENQSFKKFMLE